MSGGLLPRRGVSGRSESYTDVRARPLSEFEGCFAFRTGRKCGFVQSS